MKKIISIFFLCITLLTCFVGCATEKTYRDDTACGALIENAEKNLQFDVGISPVNQSSIAITLSPTLSGAIALSDQYLLKDTAGETCDEYGIIHIAKKEDLDIALSFLTDYFENKKADPFLYNYPDNYKVNEFEIKKFGNYIVFAAMTIDNRTILFEEIERLLLKV